MGVGFAIATAFLFASGTPFAKIFLQQVQPWMLSGLLFLGGGCGLLPIVLLRHWLNQRAVRNLDRQPDAPFNQTSGHHPKPIPYLQSQDWRWLLSSTLAGGIIAPTLLMIGLSQASAASVSLLLNFEAVFTAVLAWTVFRERWQWQIFWGIIPITAGGILLSHASGASEWSIGSLAVLGTCFTWAIDSNLTVRISHRDPFQIAMFKSGSAGLINVVLALSVGQHLPALETLFKVEVIGFLCYGLTYCCFVMALRGIGPSRTAAFLALAPLLGAVLAVLFLDESITVEMGIAAAIMTAGALLCAWEPRKIDPTPPLALPKKEIQELKRK
jgi:drug/metabolite transporter (DMT)-like permease